VPINRNALHMFWTERYRETRRHERRVAIALFIVTCLCIAVLAHYMK
jgi:hypothetical protein